RRDGRIAQGTADDLPMCGKLCIGHLVGSVHRSVESGGTGRAGTGIVDAPLHIGILMATNRKSVRVDHGPSWADSTDEDVPPPQSPAPSLLQESRRDLPVGAWIAIAIAIVLIGFLAVSVFFFRSNAP